MIKKFSRTIISSLILGLFFVVGQFAFAQNVLPTDITSITASPRSSTEAEINLEHLISGTEDVAEYYVGVTANPSTLWPDGPYTVPDSPDSSVTLSGLQADTTYYVDVQFTGSQTGLPSNRVSTSFTTPPAQVAAPAQVQHYSVDFQSNQYPLVSSTGFLYQIDGTFTSKNKALPSSLDVLFGDSPSNLTLLAGQFTNLTPSFTFSVEILDTDVDAAGVIPGEHPYVALVADGEVAAFHRLSAYQDPDEKIAIDWEPDLIEQNRPGEFAIILDGAIDNQLQAPDSLFITLGSSLGNQLTVREVTPGATGFFVSLFDQFTDIGSGAIEQILPDKNYYAIFYEGFNPVSAVNLGSFTLGTNVNPGQPGVPVSNTGQVSVGANTINLPAGSEIDVDLEFIKEGIVPCGGPGEDECNWTHLIETLERVLNLAFVLVVPFVAIGLTYVGFLFMFGGSSPEKRGKAKRALLRITIGVIAILAAWLIVATILRTLGVDADYSLLQI
jgi:hypothetical protein